MVLLVCVWFRRFQNQAEAAEPLCESTMALPWATALKRMNHALDLLVNTVIVRMPKPLFFFPAN